MDYPKEYIQFLVQFHGMRDYFECHEILEEYWKENPDDGLGDFWVMLIQIAVGQYHDRRNNCAGAAKMYASASHKMKQYPSQMLGLQLDQLNETVIERINHIDQQPYCDFNMPIADTTLLQNCINEAERLGCKWQSTSDLQNIELVDRHKLRDRSDVIEARRQALLKKGREGK